MWPTNDIASKPEQNQKVQKPHRPNIKQVIIFYFLMIAFVLQMGKLDNEV